MVPCTQTVVVSVMKRWRGKPLITMGLLMFSSTHLVVTWELTHTVVPNAHTVVVFVMKRWREDLLITTGLLKLFSNCHLLVTGGFTHTLVRDAHTMVVGVVKGRGGELTLTVVPSTHKVVVCVINRWRGNP